MLLCPFCIFGQTALSNEEQRRVIEEIDRSASKMKSLTCEFVQTKTLKLLRRELVSQGMMYFLFPNKVCWQYTTPYDYTFILNNSKVKIKSSKSVKEFDVQGNKMFRKIVDVIFECITGAGLKSSKDFQVEMHASQGAYYAKLYPKKKEIKQIYNCIEVHFNAAKNMVTHIRMEERSGDTTLIELKKAKINTTIDEKKFSLD